MARENGLAAPRRVKRAGRPNSHDVGLRIGRFSFSAIGPLMLRTSDKMNHQAQIRKPTMTRVRIAPTTRYRSPTQNVLIWKR